MKKLERNCPLCNANNHKFLDMGPPEWPMAKCQDCSMVYLAQVPDVSELFENIAWEKSSRQEHDRRVREHGISRKISRLTRKRFSIFPRKQMADLIERYAPPGNVVDVGCGSGRHILPLKDNYTPYGIEVSTALTDKSRSRFTQRGGDIVNQDAYNGLRSFSDESFTGVMMRSFLEHDINPFETLEESYRTLCTGGIVIIKVPNYECLNSKIRGEKWCGLRFPDHVNYFTPDTLSQMVQKAGFDIQRFGLSDRLPTSDNMWLIGTKNTNQECATSAA